MSKGTLTQRARQLDGVKLTVAQLQRWLGATYAQTYVVLFHLKRRGEARRVKRGGLGRYSQKPSWWRIESK